MLKTLILSTFSTLLRVTLDSRHRLREVRTLDSGRGIYFGLTRGSDRVFAVARNLDARQQVQDPRLPTNNIFAIPWPWRGQPPRSRMTTGGVDLHQIRYRDALVWLVSGQRPELWAVKPGSGRVFDQLALSDLVPGPLRHAAPPEHPGDPYHFNSLHFAPGRLLILAHNWLHGSFVLELAYQDARSFFHHPLLLGVHANLGLGSHDVYREGENLYVLDSQKSRLLCSDGRTCPLASEGGVFPRGLAADADFFYIGHGSFTGERGQRGGGTSRISIVDRRTLCLTDTVEVGPYGNTCDLLLMSAADQTDAIARPLPVEGMVHAIFKRLTRILGRSHASREEYAG